MRYYSTQRPIQPGGYPKKDAVVNIQNFDTKLFCKPIGMDAWGYIDYSTELSEQEADDYELVPEGLKTFWSVTSMFYDDGRVVSNITSTIQAAKQPENVSKSLKNKDVYIDWFDNKDDARQHVKDAENA